jgi:hypothetical protein
MTPAFGFSAGDFVSAVQLIAKVTKALNSGRGSEKEYYRTFFLVLRVRKHDRSARESLAILNQTTSWAMTLI